MPRYHIEQVETAYRTTTYTIDAADDEAALEAVGDEFGDEGDWKNHETVEITIVPVDPPGPSAHEQRLICGRGCCECLGHPSTHCIVRTADGDITHRIRSK